MVTMLETVHLFVTFMLASSYASSCMFASVSSHVCSSVSCVSSLLESESGIDTLFKVLIWSLQCKCCNKVSL